MSASKQPNPQWQDMLQLSAASYQDLLAQLDTAGVDFWDPDMRRADRHPFPRIQGVPLKVIHAEAEPSWFIVRPRNLSETGIGVLHGGFVHLETRCVIALRRLDGTVTTLEGTTVRCRHVKGRVHEVGIKFKEQIDPAGYLPVGSEFGDEDEPAQRDAG